MPEPIASLFELPYTSLNWIEGGTFLFQNKQLVTFDRGFYAGMYPVTQALYEEVMGTNPSGFKGKHRPVEKVNWKDALAFLEKLNEETRSTYSDGLSFRLPTEAMWEYCARNSAWEKDELADTSRNTHSDFSGSLVLDEVGWYDDNSRSQTQPVGLKEANLRGLHDMSGDVWEWCEDWYAKEINPDYTNGFSTQGVTDRDTRVVRGGSWYGYDNVSRLLYRGRDYPVNLNYGLGFRLFRY